MACINMYNPDGGAAFGGCAGQPSPRISFSSDFSMEPPPPPVQNRATSLRCQEDQNFEFSVGSHPMMAADQLFSKGRILPFKVDGRPPTTLRDELRGGGADDERASSKGSSRWREMLGLRKSLCVGGGRGAGNVAAAKKSDKVVAVDAEMATDMAASKQIVDPLQEL